MIREVEISCPDGTCDAHLATPEGGDTYPGVLFCMDAFGLRAAIDEWIERIAARGYAVLAPNLLYRGGRSPILEEIPKSLDQESRTRLFERIRPLMQQLTYENVARDGEAYLGYLASVATEPFGVTGYCMGGAFAMRIAGAFSERVAAAASFHGGNLATDDPSSPHLLAPRIQAEVYVGHADNDAGAMPEQQVRLDAAMNDAGVTFAGELYADAPHGFTMRDTAAYREEAAERHFERLIELLDRTLKG
jgi:carboxymethylenebutenolidase